MRIFSMTLIALLENSGRESWLQVNDVYVLGFKDVSADLESSDAKRNSLPFGDQINSFDFTTLLYQN